MTPALRTNGTLERGVRRGVAGVEADDEIDAVEVRVRDVAELEAEPVGVEAAGERLALGDDVRLHVEAEHVDLASVDAREQVVEGERQVRATGAEVDHPHAPFREGRDDVVDQLHEPVDLAELRPPLRADAAFGGLHAEGDEERDRLPLGKRVALGAVVRARRGGPRGRPAQDARLAAAREDLPVRVASWRSACRYAPPIPARSSASSAGPSTFSSVVRES